MSGLSHPELPPVNDLLKGDSSVDALKPEHGLFKALLLLTICSVVFRNPQWREILNPDFKKMDKCMEAVEGDLGNIVDDCFKNKDWQPLFNDRWFNILLMGYKLYLLNGFRTPTPKPSPLK